MSISLAPNQFKSSFAGTQKQQIQPQFTNLNRLSNQNSTKDRLFEEQSTMRNEDFESNTRDLTKSSHEEASPKSRAISQPRKSVLGKGTTSTTILMLDRQLQQLQKENKELKERLDTAYKMQHQLENELEEHQVEAKRKEEETKNIKRKFQEFQKGHMNCEKEKKDMIDKCLKLEKEKIKINEKWIKLSQRLKEGDSQKDKSKDVQTSYQKALEEIHILRVKLQAYEEGEHPITDKESLNKIFQRFSSELVCACLHELMSELSQNIIVQGNETFDIVKFQEFLKEQNCKECGHSDLIDLELGSIIVLSCKRIKDLQYTNEEMNEKLIVLNQEYENLLAQHQEKTLQFEQLQGNLLQLLQINPHQSFFNGQNTMTSSQIFTHLANQSNESPKEGKQMKRSPNSLMSSIAQPSFIIGKENINGDNLLNRNNILRNSKPNYIIHSNRSQSPIDFGGQSAIRGDCSPDNLLISRDASLLNFNNTCSNQLRPKHQTLANCKLQQQAKRFN